MKKKKCHLGIDLGGTNLKGGLVNTKGRIFAKYAYPIDANKGGKAILKQLMGFIHEISHDAALKGIQIKGIGIGTPGAVDFQKGCVGYGAGNLPGWKGVPFIKIIQKDFRIPVFAHNDATLAALAEARFGMGKDKKNIICVTLGTGIGGGVIIDGKVYHGRSAYAGEIGHMKIVPDGRACTCGARGCWEAYASATGVVNMAKEYSQKRKSSQLYKKYHKHWKRMGAKE
ncbi:ROK family protein, partial [PVC group bacterium]|nr:ROK family protein [PVC group bacterium]